MFEFNKEKLSKERAKKEAEHEANKMLSKMLTEMLLQSDAPEYVKLAIRSIDKAKTVNDKIFDVIVKKYCLPGKEANAETLKKVLEYLELVEVGIEQFAETLPYIAENKEAEEIC